MVLESSAIACSGSGRSGSGPKRHGSHLTRVYRGSRAIRGAWSEDRRPAFDAHWKTNGM
jgi:hypothetical protein